MTSIGSPSPFFLAGKKAYQVDRSLRFNDNDSAYLQFTPSSTGNRKTWTWSSWFKRSNLTLSSQATIFHSYGSGSQRTELIFSGNGDQLIFQQGRQSGTGFATTTGLFRDVSAWYHVVCVADFSNGTASNRFKIYINNVEQANTIGSTFTDADGQMPVSGVPIEIGGRTNNRFFDGYMAEINFIDGQALTPSYFGETDATTGQWNPKKYVGSYGTNGFYLNFSDNSGTTATTLGKDLSGNGNNFTPNNFAVSDAVKDSPTNNFATLNAVDFNGGSLVEGNLKQDNSGATNTSATFGMQSGKWYWEIYFNSSSGGVFGVGIGESRKGSALNDLTRHYGYSTNGQFYTTVNGSSTAAGYGATLSAGDILSVKFNADTREIDFLKNNSSQGYTVTLADGFLYLPCFHANNSDITVNFGQDSTFASATSSGGNTDGSGQGDFKYTVPTGYKALCSANLPDPTILLPNKHFNTLLWTGTQTTRNITGLDFQPDWVWVKKRSGSEAHDLQDAVRGATKRLSSNTTAAEITAVGSIDSFNSDGITTNDAGTTNESGFTYVGWFWNAGDTDGKTYVVKVHDFSGNNRYIFDDFQTQAVTLDLAEGGTYVFDWSDSSAQSHPIRFSTTADGTHGGGSEYTTGVTKDDSAYKTTITVAASTPTLYYYCQNHSGMGGAINTNSTLGSSNFDGSIQSTVKVNASAGFSITRYTGAGGVSTIGHGLGVEPNMFMVKSRTQNSDWEMYWKVLGNTERVNLNSQNAKSTGINGWNSTSPTSTVVTINGGASGNTSGQSHIMYAFSEVSSYSKFGTYIGNGNASGTFVFLGFRPAWVLVKRVNQAASWSLHDNRRAGYNADNDYIHPDLAQAESDGSPGTIDMFSNGFKCTTTAGTHNNSGGTFIYLAFAESPFKYARAR